MCYKYCYPISVFIFFSILCVITLGDSVYEKDSRIFPRYASTSRTTQNKEIRYLAALNEGRNDLNRIINEKSRSLMNTERRQIGRKLQQEGYERGSNSRLFTRYSQKRSIVENVENRFGKDLYNDVMPISFRKGVERDRRFLRSNNQQLSQRLNSRFEKTYSEQQRNRETERKYISNRHIYSSHNRKTYHDRMRYRNAESRVRENRIISKSLGRGANFVRLNQALINDADRKYASNNNRRMNDISFYTKPAIDNVRANNITVHHRERTLSLARANHQISKIRNNEDSCNLNLNDRRSECLLVENHRKILPASFGRNIINFRYRHNIAHGTNIREVNTRNFHGLISSANIRKQRHTAKIASPISRFIDENITYSASKPRQSLPTFNVTRRQNNLQRISQKQLDERTSISYGTRFINSKDFFIRNAHFKSEDILPITHTTKLSYTVNQIIQALLVGLLILKVTLHQDGFKPKTRLSFLCIQQYSVQNNI